MGGNIWENSRRLAKPQYNRMCIEVLDLVSHLISEELSDGVPKSKLRKIIPAYKNKQDFGDLDIIINSKYVRSTDRVALVKEVFNVTDEHISKNSHVVSILYMNFQIDLIFTSDEDYQTSVDYFSFNDLGNLVGRLAHKWGIKFGHRGSHIVIRDDDYIVGEILLTKSTKTLFTLLDLNYSEWVAGFNEPEDMFEWLISSKYFNKEIYLLDNRNHQSRVRDRKRKTYSYFLKWLKTVEIENEYQYNDVSEHGGYNIREPFFTLICEKFPHVKEEYDSLIAKCDKHRKFKQNFNGNIVMKFVPYEGEELGKFMKYCKEHIIVPSVYEEIVAGTKDIKELVTFANNCYMSGMQEAVINSGDNNG